MFEKEYGEIFDGLRSLSEIGWDMYINPDNGNTGIFWVVGTIADRLLDTLSKIMENTPQEID